VEVMALTMLHIRGKDFMLKQMEFWLMKEKPFLGFSDVLPMI
jgi:hypothetical protein